MDDWYNVIIPMAGIGSRFKEYGFAVDKYMLPMDLKGTTMIEKAVLSLGLPSHKTRMFFIVRCDACTQYCLEQTLHNICDAHGYECHIITTTSKTDGPASSAYLAKPLFDTIPGANQQRLIISNSDQVLDWNFEEFISTCNQYDGCVLTYEPNYPIELGSQDKHSFVRLDAYGAVVEVKEKVALSNEALVGVHYFQQASMFWDAYTFMVAKDLRAPNGEFYISLAYQALLDCGFSVGKHFLKYPFKFHPVGEPLDYFAYVSNFGDMHIFTNKVTNGKTIFTNGITYITYYDEYERHHSCKDVICINLDDSPKFGCGRRTLVIADPRYDTSTINQCDFADYVRGWIVGDFQPSVLKVNDYEVGILTHKKDEQWDFHYHSNMTEINLLVRGHMMLNEKVIKQGDIFTLVPNQVSCPKFLTDCLIVCIKTPSVIGDKIVV